MIHNKKCIICLSTLDGEQPIIEQIGLTTRTVHALTGDNTQMTLARQFLCNTVNVHTHHSGILILTVGVFALLFCWIGKSIKGLKSYSLFAL